MPTETTISQEHLDAVRQLQSDYASTTAKLGHIRIELFVAQRRLDELKAVETQLLDEYSATEQREYDMIQEFATAYGEGRLNIETGVYTVE